MAAYHVEEALRLLIVDANPVAAYKSLEFARDRLHKQVVDEVEA